MSREQKVIIVKESGRIRLIKVCPTLTDTASDKECIKYPVHENYFLI